MAWVQQHNFDDCHVKESITIVCVIFFFTDLAFRERLGAAQAYDFCGRRVEDHYRVCTLFHPISC